MHELDFFVQCPNARQLRYILAKINRTAIISVHLQMRLFTVALGRENKTLLGEVVSLPNLYSATCRGVPRDYLAALQSVTQLRHLVRLDMF